MTERPTNCVFTAFSGHYNFSGYGGRLWYRTDLCLMLSDQIFYFGCSFEKSPEIGRFQILSLSGVWSAVLRQNRLCQLWIRLLDMDGILQPFFIIKHKLSSSLLLPWPRLVYPVPIILWMMDMGKGQRTIFLRILMKGLLIFPVVFPKIRDSPRILRMGVQIKAGIHTGKTGGENAPQQLFFG